MDETTLTPEQARQRFGKLTAAVGNHRVHRHFEDQAGEWRPEFDPDMRLVRYRLFRAKPGARKVVWRPKGKR